MGHPGVPHACVGKPDRFLVVISTTLFLPGVTVYDSTRVRICFLHVKGCSMVITGYSFRENKHPIFAMRFSFNPPPFHLYIGSSGVLAGYVFIDAQMERENGLTNLVGIWDEAIKEKNNLPKTYQSHSFVDHTHQVYGGSRMKAWERSNFSIGFHQILGEHCLPVWSDVGHIARLKLKHDPIFYEGLPKLEDDHEIIFFDKTFETFNYMGESKNDFRGCVESLCRYWKSIKEEELNYFRTHSVKDMVSDVMASLPDLPFETS